MPEYYRHKTAPRDEKLELIGRVTAGDGKDYLWVLAKGQYPATYSADYLDPWTPEPAKDQVWRSKGRAANSTTTYRILTVGDGYVAYAASYEPAEGNSQHSARPTAAFLERFEYVS